MHFFCASVSPVAKNHVFQSLQNKPIFVKMFPTSKTKILFYIIIAFLCCSKIISACKNSSQSTNQPITNLGRYLFFDRRLSINNTRSCGTCHNPQFAFTDGYKRSLGAYADLHQRNTQPLFNVEYLKYFTAADSTLHSPLEQMDNPLFNTHPVEMGVKGNEDAILKRIQEDKEYQKLFLELGKDISWPNIKLAISDFISSLQSNNSNYDKYKKGDSNALNKSEKRGMQLFLSTELKCASCHGGFNFSTPNITNEKGDTVFYFNTGLYNIDGKGAYPDYDQGLFQLTKNKTDMGKFRVPTLRNLAYTAPYLNDGDAASLMDVINIYADGGKTIHEGANKGDGVINPNKHTLINGFLISETDKMHLNNFLLSLSDSSFIQNKNYQNPFTEDETKKKY
jgi:cytochrome c peroxidase